MTPDDRLQLANAYITAGRYDKAIENANLAIAHASTAIHARYLRGVAALGKCTAQQAKRDLGDRRPLPPQFTTCLDGARGDLEASLHGDPKRADYVAQMGVLAFFEEDYGNAIARLTQARAMGSLTPRFALYLAKSHISMAIVRVRALGEKMPGDERFIVQFPREIRENFEVAGESARTAYCRTRVDDDKEEAWAVYRLVHPTKIESIDCKEAQSTR